MGGSGCVPGYQAVRSVLTAAGTTCVDWHPRREELAFSWRTCLLITLPSREYAQCLPEKSHLGEEARQNL